MTNKDYFELRRSIGPVSYVAPLLGVTTKAIERREAGKHRVTEEAFAALRSIPPYWFKDPLPIPDPTFVPMPNCPGYAVSKDGRCLGCRTKDPKKEYPYKAWEPLSPAKGVKDYWVVGMVLDGKMHQFKLHQAVLWAFKGGPPFEGANGRHLDDNKENNHIDNLEWGTCKENKADAIRNGVSRGAHKGALHHGAKLSEADVIEIKRRRASGETLRTIGDAFGVSEGQVSLIYNNKTWKHL